MNTNEFSDIFFQIAFSFAKIAPDYSESQDLSIVPLFASQFNLVLKIGPEYYFRRYDTIYEHKFGFAETFLFTVCDSFLRVLNTKYMLPGVLIPGYSVCESSGQDL